MESEKTPGRLILLTGPKHSGKSTVGRLAAALLKIQFLDLDEYIQTLAGKSPRELYKEGPAVFQKAEEDALRELLAKNAEALVAAGGGICDNAGAMALVAGTPGLFAVYLDVSAATAWERIASDPGGLPPFLQTENPRQTHRALHERRAALYKKAADLIVSADGKSAEENAAFIAAALGGLPEGERHG